jgi:2,7-dihydroxy-5-methyl-1-naphthoate 7-O-methyltransferase
MDAEAADLYTAADLVTPWVLRSAVTFGIPDELENGPRSAADLAEATSAPPTTVERLLFFLTAAGYTQADPADRERVGLTPKGLLLTTSADPLLAALLHGRGAAARIDRAMSSLLDASGGGESGYEHTHGKPFYQDLSEAPEVFAAWNALMSQGIGDIAEEILAHVRLGGDEEIVDVGGGAGGFMLALARAHPEVSGRVLELPLPAAAADAAFRSAAVSHRCRGVAGSFFDAIPAADVYTLISVLHEWDDDAALAILRRCAAGLRGDGSIIVCERVTDSGTGDQLLVANLDIMTLIATGGRERTRAEFARLLERACLVAERAVVMPSGRYVIQARLA